MEDIKKFLDFKQIKYREDTNDFQMNCFICNENRERLGIQKKTGQWRCFNCGAKGKKLSSFKYAFEHRVAGNLTRTEAKEESSKKEVKCTIHKDFHKAFLKTFEHPTYKSKNYMIESRKLSEETLKHFQIGSRKKWPKNIVEEYTVIPYIRNGQCVNVKYRAVSKTVDKKFKWKREKGGISILFNHDVLHNFDYEDMIIAEAEIDCMSIWDMDFKNVVSQTTGADAFADAWVEQLKRYKRIYIALDNDEAGKIGSKKIATLLGLDRCYYVTWPEFAPDGVTKIKDANDFRIHYKREDFAKMLKEAKQYSVGGVLSLNQITQRAKTELYVTKELDDSGFDTPWPGLNKIMGKVKRGHYWAVCARPKVGKTTLCMNWLDYLASKKVPVGIFSCEMKETDLFGMLARNYDRLYPPSMDSSYPKERFSVVEMALMKKNINVFYPPEAIRNGEKFDLNDVDMIEAKLVEFITRYKIQFMVFDNLLFVARGAEANNIADKLSQMFKRLSIQYNCTNILITHPRKSSKKDITNDDLKGTSSLFQDVDGIILMNRTLPSDQDEDESGHFEKIGMMCYTTFDLKVGETRISVTSRFADGGKTTLAFHSDMARFSETSVLYKGIRRFQKAYKKSNSKG